MAVKVMVAPAIARGEIGKPAPAGKGAGPAAAPKPRRRRSSVYDADGNEVFITLMCLKCHKMRPLSQFGLRKMADGAIRNQPWCRTCRSGTADKPSRRSSVAPSPEAREPAAPAVAPAPTQEEPKRRSGSVATEIAAALAAGLGR